LTGILRRQLGYHGSLLRRSEAKMLEPLYG
jgi:hypothetical protein